MARFIEVQDGVFVRTDAITSIRKPDALESKIWVFTHHRKWSSDIPFDTLIAMLKNDESEDRQISGDDRVKSTMDKLEKVLGNVGHYAG